jgi:hypothetical protein
MYQPAQKFLPVHKKEYDIIIIMNECPLPFLII